jgi:hypothetical protein
MLSIYLKKKLFSSSYFQMENAYEEKKSLFLFYPIFFAIEEYEISYPGRSPDLCAVFSLPSHPFKNSG